MSRDARNAARPYENAAREQILGPFNHRQGRENRSLIVLRRRCFAQSDAQRVFTQPRPISDIRGGELGTGKLRYPITPGRQARRTTQAPSAKARHYTNSSGEITGRVVPSHHMDLNSGSRLVSCPEPAFRNGGSWPTETVTNAKGQFKSLLGSRARLPRGG